MSTTTAFDPTSALRNRSKPPAAAPAATRVVIALAVVLVALGAVAVRDALLATGSISGSPWIAAALSYVDGLTAQAWMVPAGVAVAAIGIALVLAAVTPRRRTHVPLSAEDTWITSRDVVRIARGAAQHLTGVGGVTATGSARKITLTVTTLGGYQREPVKDAVQTAATNALTPLARPPRVRVRMKEQKLS